MHNVCLIGFVNFYGCDIGDALRLAPSWRFKKDSAGNRCKVSSHSFLCEDVILEDDVFIGHNVTFTNERHPRSTNGIGNSDGIGLAFITTRVKQGASIGSEVTLLCGITIGKNALVGAGSVVTRGVPPGTVAAGNPARIIKSRALRQ